MRALLVLWTGLLCVLPVLVWATAELPVVQLFNADQYRLDKHVLLLDDPSGALTIEDVSGDAAHLFTANTDTILNLGFTNNVYWLKFQVAYPDSYPNKAAEALWYLEAGRTLMDMAELYWQTDEGHWQQMNADTRSAWDEREVRYVTSVYPVSLRLGEQRTYYLRLQNQSAFYVPLVIWTPQALTEKITFLDFVYGLYYGGMLIMILYNLFVYLSVRDITYIYYIAYLSSVVFFQFIELGHGTVIFDNAHELFPKSYITYSVWMGWASAILYTRKFLDIERNHPFIDTAMKSLVVIVAFNILISTQMDTSTSLVWVSNSSAMMLTLIPFLSLYVWAKGNENGAYFSGAWLFTVIGLFIYATVALGALPATPLLLSAMPLGTLMEALLLSFALAERIKHLQRSALDADRHAMTNLARYRSLFDNAMEGMYQCALDGRLVNANPAMASFFGFASPLALLEQPAAFQQACLRAGRHLPPGLLQQGFWREEIWVEHPGGGDACYDHSVQLIRNTLGEPSHIEGVLVDISERKAHQAAKKARELAQLQQSVARQTSIAKSEFLERMNHGIRTPLTAIIGFSQCLQSQDMTPGERRRAVATLLHSSRDLLQLINNVLDYSKLEAGKLELENMTADPVELLRNLLSELAPVARSRRLRVQMAVQAPLPNQITADALRLRQLLHGLIGLALNEASDSVEIVLSATQQPLSLCCEVRWQAPHHKTWHTLINDTRQIPTGPAELRLAISRQLASLMKGRVTYWAEHQQTHFLATLPLTEVPSSGWQATSSVVDITEAAPPTPARQRFSVDTDTLQGHVLLAEDNPVNQALIQRVLRKFGLRVTTVEQGDQAVEAALSTADIDLVLMDVNMPVLDGLSATRQLREAEYTKPIYALTAEQGQEEVAASLQAGCDGHLLKPLELAKLRQVLQRYLANENMPQTNSNVSRLPPVN